MQVHGAMPAACSAIRASADRSYRLPTGCLQAVAPRILHDDIRHKSGQIAG
jgi:hypothetical protein